MDWLRKILGGQASGSAITGFPSLFSTNSEKVKHGKLIESYTRWVYVCVDRIAQAVADVEIELKRRTDNEVETIEDHEALALLEKPNDLQTGRMLRYVMAAHTELTGDAFLLNEDDDQIIPLIPDHIEINTDETGFKIQNYELRRGNDRKTIQPEEMLHYRYPNPKDIKSGLGVVSPIAKWIDVDTLMTDFNKKFFENGAMLGGMIETEATDNDQLEMIKTGFEDKHRGIKDMHRIGILPKGAEFKPREMSPKDMEFEEGSRQFRDKILAAFGVPKTVLGISEDVNRSTAESHNFVFQAHTVKPKAQQLVDFLNERYLELFDDDQLFFDFVDPTPENEELKIEKRQAALGGQSWMTVNEVREAEGKPPVEGGDRIIRPQNTAAVGEVEGETQNTVRPQHSRHFESKSKQVVDKDDVKDVARNLVEKRREDELEKRRKEFFDRLDPVEQRVQQALREQLEELRPDVIQNVSQAIKEVEQSEIYDKEKAVATTINTIEPIIKEMGDEEGKRAMQALAQASESFDTSRERYERAIRGGVEKMADSFHETNLTRLESTLNTGIQEGEPLEDLVDRINNEFDDFTEKRARRVARTEVNRAANNARLQAYQQSGVVEEVRWHTNPGACPFCAPKNGEVVSTGTNFVDEGATVEGEIRGDRETPPTMTADYGAVKHPPLHPNCRCFLVPETISVRSQDEEVYEEIINILEDE